MWIFLLRRLFFPGLRKRCVRSFFLVTFSYFFVTRGVAPKRKVTRLLKHLSCRVPGVCFFSMFETCLTEAVGHNHVLSLLGEDGELPQLLDRRVGGL